MAKTDLPPGITATATGYRVFVRVPWPGSPTGKLRSKSFPRTATVREMQLWRDAERLDAERRPAEPRTIDTRDEAKPEPDLPPGIKPTTNGYRAFVRVPWPGYPEGKLCSKRFSRTATVREMEHWQEDQRVDARRRSQQQAAAAPAPPPVGEGFLADADRYLDAVRTMPQFAERRRHLQLWAALFGERPTATITSAEIRAQRERWLTVGPRRVATYPKGQPPIWRDVAEPLGPQEVNLRLRALENFFTVLFPKGDNPVREVPECDTPPPQARGQSFALAREVLAYMPDVTRAPKGGAAEEGSLSRVRFEAMLLTGLTPTQLGELEETDVDWTTPSVTPPRRRKGRAQGRRQRPRKPPTARRVMPSAVPVLRRLFALKGNQPFSRQSLARSVRRAVAAANQVRAAQGQPLIDPKLRLYDWTRHTFGTETYRAYRDLKVVQELMGHSDIRQTDIYAKAAIQEHTKAAVAALDALAQQSAPGTVADPPVTGYLATVTPTFAPVTAAPVRTIPRLIKKNAQ